MYIVKFFFFEAAGRSQITYYCFNIKKLLGKSFIRKEMHECI